jgi:soluble lytic murein transglycosylase-like protein
VSYKAAESVSELFDVPLDESVQKEIIKLCEGAGIEPAVVYAMMWRESRFQSDAEGDNGQSFGLMQIMQKWHVERMERLGVDNLLDPVQNATVGIDLMAELLEKYDGNLSMALTAYNCGTGGAYKNFFQHGVYANAYAEEIIEKAGELDAAR